MLTGTPLQNDLEELQNLLCFLLPDVFHADVAAQLADEQVRLLTSCACLVEECIRVWICSQAVVCTFTALSP